MKTTADTLIEDMRQRIIKLLDDKLALRKALGCPEGTDLLEHATALMAELRVYRLKRMAAEYNVDPPADATEAERLLIAVGQVGVYKALKMEGEC